MHGLGLGLEGSSALKCRNNVAAEIQRLQVTVVLQYPSCTSQIVKPEAEVGQESAKQVL